MDNRTCAVVHRTCPVEHHCCPTVNRMSSMIDGVFCLAPNIMLCEAKTYPMVFGTCSTVHDTYSIEQKRCLYGPQTAVGEGGLVERKDVLECEWYHTVDGQEQVNCLGSVTRISTMKIFGHCKYIVCQREVTLVTRLFLPTHPQQLQCCPIANPIVALHFVAVVPLLRGGFDQTSAGHSTLHEQGWHP